MIHKITDFIQDGVLHNPDFQTVRTAAYVEKQKITAMGGNSSEINDIDAIVQKARDGTLSFVEAILKIESIGENKHGNGGHGLEG